MAKNKRKRELLPPLHVGDVNGEAAYLSDRVQRDILMIPAGPARDAFKAAKVQEALKAAEGRAKYKQLRDDLRFVPSEKIPGLIWVNGTGTSNSGCFTKQQALAFLARIEEFRTAVNALPDPEVKNS